MIKKLFFFLGLGRFFLSHIEKKDRKRLCKLLPKKHGYKIKNKPTGLEIEHNNKRLVMSCYHNKIAVSLFRNLKGVRQFNTVKVVKDNEVPGIIERYFEAV